ncbi:MAG: helix-turn-helix domain-containing protein [Egibacteraceae bacterium]
MVSSAGSQLVTQVPRPDDTVAMSLSSLRNLPPTITVPQAGRICGIGRNAAYEAARTGQLPVIRIGRRLLVPTARLLRLLGLDEDEVASA